MHESAQIKYDEVIYSLILIIESAMTWSWKNEGLYVWELYQMNQSR